MVVSKKHSRKRSPQGIALVTILVAFILIAGGAIVMVLFNENRTKPEFPFMTAAPDATLVGTVAYVEPKSNCITLAALSGGATKELYCLPAWSTTDAATLGKPMPPQLVWLTGGKLEVTYFRMTLTPGPNVVKGWQFILDIATGARTDIDSAQIPAQPNLTQHPTVNASGDTVKFSSNSENGHVKVWVEKNDGNVNTLLDERGPGKYTYGINAAFWGPDGKTIFAEDGRILVITPDGAIPVRTLVQEGEFGFEADDAARSAFAVTTEQYVTTSK